MVPNPTMATLQVSVETDPTGASAAADRVTCLREEEIFSLMLTPKLAKGKTTGSVVQLRLSAGAQQTRVEPMSRSRAQLCSAARAQRRCKVGLKQARPKHPIASRPVGAQYCATMEIRPVSAFDRHRPDR